MHRHFGIPQDGPVRLARTPAVLRIKGSRPPSAFAALTVIWANAGIAIVALLSLAGCVGAPMDIRPAIARVS